MAVEEAISGVDTLCDVRWKHFLSITRLSSGCLLVARMLLTRGLLTRAKGLSFIPLKCTNYQDLSLAFFFCLSTTYCVQTREHMHTHIHIE